MDVKLFLTVFSTVFVAELGDKTQLATFLFAADAKNPWVTVLVASASALVLSAAARHVPVRGGRQEPVGHGSRRLGERPRAVSGARRPGRIASVPASEPPGALLGGGAGLRGDRPLDDRPGVIGGEEGDRGAGGACGHDFPISSRNVCALRGALALASLLKNA